MKFDFEGARKAGLSDSEIVDYISKLPNNGNLSTLKEMGASPTHIVNLWSASKNFSIDNPTDKISNPTKETQEQQSVPDVSENPLNIKDLFQNIPDTSRNHTPTNNPISEQGDAEIEQAPFTPTYKESIEPSVSKQPIPMQNTEPPIPTNGILNAIKDTLYSETGIALGDAKARAKMQEERDAYLFEQIANSNKTYRDLNPEEKDYINRKYTSDNTILGIRFPAGIAKSKEEQYNDTIKDVRDKKQLKQLLESDLNYNDLSLDQKQFLTSAVKKSTLKSIKYLFDSKEEMFDDLKREYQIHKIAPTIEQSLSELNNISANKRIYNILSSDSEMKNKYLQDVYNIATNAGFDNVSVDSVRHKMYLLKDDRAYELKDGFLDSIWEDIKSSKFELGGSIAGAIAGSKIGPSPQLKLVGGILGGAIGAVGGSGLDYKINSWLLKRDKDNSELLGKMLEAGTLSAVGDVATLGAIKLVKTGYNSLKKIPAYANELRENFTNQNINGAMKILEDVGISKEKAEQTAQKMDQYVQTRFAADKEDSFLDKAFKKVSKINDSVKEKEKIAFDVAYADPVLWKYIGAVAKNEPKFSNFIHNSVTQRAKKISLDPQVKLGDIKEAIKDYEQSLSADYGEVIDLLDMALPNYRFYPQEFLNNKLSKIAEHIGENKSEGIIAGLNNQIKDMGDGLSVSQMIDVRKLINKTLRKNSKFDYNDIGALKDINSYIDNNIEEALLKNTKVEPKLEVLYDEWKKINAKYADYKELQDSKLYKDIFSENYNNDEKLGNAFINWSKTDERLADSIIGRLDPRMQDKTQAFILAKSIDKHIQDTLSDGKVVDFLELKKTLSYLEPKITNKSLKDHIKILKDMSDLFYNDINLMREAGQINILTPNSGSGISHDLIARAHTSTISNIYRTIQRFLPTTAGKNSAFLYHLRKAMNMSRNSKELLFDLATSSTTPPSMLKELRPAIEAYNSRVGSVIDKAQEIQTQKDEKNFLDMLESSQNYQRSLNDKSINNQTLGRMETTGASDVGSTGEQVVSHRGDTEALLPDSGKIRATNRKRDGEFGRVSRSDEGGNRSLRSSIDGGRDGGAGTAGKISRESQKIRGTNRSTTGTSRGRLEVKQTADSTSISQEGLPPSPSLNNLAKSLKKNQPSLEKETITDFGTNYPEYYHDGKGAIQKLLQEKHGQVQGAFYKEGLGDIDLVWGNSKMGLAHILEKHPEVIEKIPEIIEKGKIDKGTNRIFLNTDDARVAIALDYKGEDKKWIITAYEKDYPSSAYPHQEQLTPTTSAHRMQDNLGNNPTTQALKNQDPLKTITDFGTNYPEYYHDGKGAIQKLLQEKHGQVQGAFYKEGLGDIDLVWGNSKMGLAHILEKHPEVIEKIPEIINDGKLLTSQAGIHTILHNDYKLGLSKGYNHKGDNNWIITAYEDVRGKGKTFDSTPFDSKETLFKTSMPNPTTQELKNQPSLENITDFGTNYPEYYHNGKGAIQKLLQEKHGQVQGAFYKEGLGDIDLVWGEVTNREKHTGYGLAHIIDKHPEIIDKIPEIMDKGIFLKDEKNRLKIQLENEIIGIKDNWKGKKTNHWIVTSYEKEGDKSLYTSSSPLKREEILSHSSLDDFTIEQLKNQPSLKTISDFGTNYPEYYHDGKGAIQKLLQEKHGQVQGAFYKEGLGDIDLVWGNSKMGLAHILEKHPEVIEKIPEIINDGKLVVKKHNATQIVKDDYKVVLKSNLYGKTTENKWVLTAYEDVRGKGKFIDSTPFDSKETLFKTSMPNPTTQALKNQDPLKNITDFGTNYPEYYHDGKGAIQKLLQEKHGQVQGAFYKEGLGDIDLVWGNSKMGLAHIIDKHPEITPEKLENIITEGKASIRKNEAAKIEKDGYKVVLKGNWKGDLTENKWIVTAYENNKEASSISSDANHIEESLSKTSRANPITEQLKNQLDEFDNFIKERLPLQPMLTQEDANALYNKIIQDWLDHHPNMDRDFVFMYDFYLKNKMISKTPLTHKSKELLSRSLDGFNRYKDKILSKKSSKQELENISDFGTNYPEYYHNGKGAIQKLLQEKHGQVQGAFYRSDIGDITLVWGKEGTGKSDGFGLAKIAKFHPEALDKLDELIKTLPIVKESPNRYQLENKKYKLAIRKEYEGNKENWVLTAFEKDSNSVSSRTDFRNTHTQATDKTTSVRDTRDSTTQALKNQDLLKTISDFGTNYPEYYHDGKGAIQKLLKEKHGQVQGAFYKEGLGDIDLVWGNSKMGLAHILEKHPEVIEKIPEIIKKGEVKNTNGIDTIILKSNDGDYHIGISKGWNHKGDNNWIITAYEKVKSSHPDVRPSDEVASRGGNNLPSNDSRTNPTTEKLKNQPSLENISDFGTNYPEYYHDGKGAIQKLLQEKHGQVQGAFYKEGLGDIDLVWGEVTNREKHTGYGLAHIIDKHPEIIDKIPEIVEKGEIIKDGAFETIVFKNDELYKVGLSKGWDGKGQNRWILTAYENTRLPHSDFPPSNGVASRDVLPSNNLHINLTAEQLKSQALLKMGKELEKKYPDFFELIIEVFRPANKSILNYGPNAYDTLKAKYQDLISKSSYKNVEEYYRNTLNMLNDPEIEKLIKNMTDDAYVALKLKQKIRWLEKSKNNPRHSSHTLQIDLEELEKYKKMYERKMNDIYGEYLLEESHQDLIKEAFSEFSSFGILSEKTKTALEKNGHKVVEDKNRILISFTEEKRDKDLEPLGNANTIKAIINPDGYKEFDSLGNEIKEISITPNAISSTEKQGNITTTETLDLTTNTSTKQVEIQNPEITPPITSPSSSSAPSSSTIAKLKDDFKIDPNASVPKSPKKRFDNNIEAIKILKKLEENKTLPTLEEKQKLSLYVGWGGLANSFKEGSPEDTLLRDLLSEKEYIKARNSTLSSYYTPYFVVDSMYKALQKMGFSGGEILEPSVGVGNFFGLLPNSLRHTSNLTGIELDDTTAKIAKYLYPSAKIEHTGYENALLAKNNYDLVIGNPPYGSFSVYDKNFKKESKHNIHNYFMLKNLALTKEDGVLAQIITTNFLDAKNPETRELIAKEAEFLGAIRLPQGSFDDTQVATDIVFFRKLKRGETSPSKEWVNLKNIPDTQGKEDIPINSYFVDNPQYMLGTPGRYGGMYGADTIGFRSNGNIQVQLQTALEDMTEGIHINTRPIFASVDIAQKTIDNLEAKSIGDLLHSGYMRPGGIGADAKSGGIWRLNQYEELEKVTDLELIDKTQEDFDKLTEVGKKAKLAQIKTIKEMIPAISEIRDSLMQLKKMQLDTMADEASIDIQRKNLNTLYDAFRSKFHTYLNDKKIAKAFDGDPTYPHIAALEEDYKRVDKKYQAKKADIFTKRTQFPYVRPTKAKDIEDGIFISYNQNGKLDFETIAELLDRDSESIKKEMLDKSLAFKDENGNIIYAPEFISGNIIQKIKSLEGIELDEYQNKALLALKKAIPPRVEIEGIGINMGANYIPIEIYQDFAKEVLGGNEKGVSYEKLTDKFIVNFKSSIEADNAFGVVGEHKTISASDVFESALNDKKITMGVKKEDGFHQDSKGQNALDQQIQAMKENFKNFIYKDYKRAEKIENVYNDIFNNTRLREFDGSFLKLEGSNDSITLRPHQKNAIYRIISSPATLLDHTVGTGKTYTMVGSVMELRRLGLAKKPLIVVPNHIVNQFSAEFARLYPNANILATRRFDKKSRQRTLSAITTGDWDAIIIGHSNFEMLPMSGTSQMNFLYDQINMFMEAIKAEKIESDGKSLSVKNLEKALESKKIKLNKLMDAKKDETIDFDDLGIDALFLDEAHEFKNLEFFSRQNISGLGNQKGSKKAFDLFMKTRYLTNQNKKIVFATGTPISNSIAELYTLQKYLDFEGLKQKGINSFDQWSKTFGKIETRFEYHPSGGFKLANRFSGYINMPELIKEYKKFSDVIVNEDVAAMLKLQGKEFDLPKADFITVDIKKSPRQEDLMKEIMRRSDDIDKGKVALSEDNYLKVTTDGKKGSLDMRLIDPLYEDNPFSKVNRAIANIIKEYNKWKEDRGTQLVFLDMSTPKNKNPKAKKELDELLKRIEQGDEEAEEILKAKGGSDYIKVVSNDGFSVYEDIKDKLIKEGIPEKEIAFIHDFDTDKKKAELFTKVNDGDVRILLGSTSKMGAGTNVQERIIAIHHLDAPWRPADIEQRNGRGIRQGNSLYEKYGKDKFKVNIYTYVTKGMLDTMIFEKLHTKAKFISQLRKGELSGREIEDMGDEVLNFAEIQAATLEDKRYLKVLELKREIESLEALQKNIANVNLRTNREINSLEYALKHKPKEIQDFKTDMEIFNKGGNKVQIGNTTYIRGEKDNGLSQALEEIRIDRNIQNIYKYNGFIIEASVSKRNADFGYIDLIAHSPSTEESYLISTTRKQDFKLNGALSKIDNYFKAQRLLAMQDELKKAQTNLPKLKASLKKFDKQKELEEKTKQHTKLIKELKIKLNSHPYIGLGLFGAMSGLNFDYNQDGKNDEADMLIGALGAIIGGSGLKYLLSRNVNVLKNVLKHHFPDKKEAIDTAFKKDIQREKRGIYNVVYNDKLATMIKKDLQSVDDFIRFSKGRHKEDKRGFGAMHIKARHTNAKEQGYITQQELLNIGNYMREYLKKYKEPFIDKNGARIYEWKNDRGIRFRVIVDKRKGAQHNILPPLPQPSSYGDIITFYSDRNLKQKMKFRNPNIEKKDITIW